QGLRLARPDGVRGAHQAAVHRRRHRHDQRRSAGGLRAPGRGDGRGAQPSEGQGSSLSECARLGRCPMSSSIAPDADRPATVADCKRVIRRKVRKHEVEEEHGLNIYPMMDMMTILLVFLIQSFASGAAEVVQSEELQIPASTSMVAASEALGVIVSNS